MGRRHPYDWQRDPEDAWSSFAAIAHKARGFLEALREQGIHIGIGSPPHCAACEQPWPCQVSKEQP
jgi:hypothetical protein